MRTEPGSVLAVIGERQPVPDEPSEPSETVDVRALVDRARDGDRLAIGAIYDLYADRIYRYVLVKVGNQSDAEDITAEIFIRVIEALPRFRWQDVPFLAWIFRIAHNQVVSHYRRSSTRTARSIEDMDFVDPQVGPETLVEQQLTLDDIHTAAKQLPEAQRRVFELRCVMDLSVRETATILNKSENNVKVLQHKALARLQKLLRGDR